MQANTLEHEEKFDYFLSSLKVIIPQISQNEDVINTASPNTYNFSFSSSTTRSFFEATACVKLQ